MCNVKTECKCDPKVVGHIHAELMMQYVEDARETDRPWERWEFLSPTRGWSELMRHPFWGTAVKYRRKSRTHMVNGIEVPAPLNSRPKVNSVYWIADPSEIDYTMDYVWNCCNFDKLTLERGLVYATKEAAVANAMAMIGRKVS